MLLFVTHNNRLLIRMEYRLAKISGVSVGPRPVTKSWASESKRLGTPALKALVVVLSKIAQLLATVWNCCAHASAKWRSSVFMHVSVNDFNFHSSVIRCAVTPR